MEISILFERERDFLFRQRMGEGIENFVFFIKINGVGDGIMFHILIPPLNINIFSTHVYVCVCIYILFSYLKKYLILRL